MPLQLVWPSESRLASYVGALRRGWSPETLRAASAEEELARIQADPARFVAQQVDREGRAPPATLPDGTKVPRIPGYQLWMWDGEFAGRLGFRWQPGTTALPPYCLGHIGYSVVPWKRQRGYATRALGLLLPIVRQEGLPFVELTTDPANVASQQVIMRNGGVLVGRFDKPATFGDDEGLRFRINLRS